MQFVSKSQYFWNSETWSRGSSAPSATPTGDIRIVLRAILAHASCTDQPDVRIIWRNNKGLEENLCLFQARRGLMKTGTIETLKILWELNEALYWLRMAESQSHCCDFTGDNGRGQWHRSLQGWPIPERRLEIWIFSPKVLRLLLWGDGLWCCCSRALVWKCGPIWKFSYVFKSYNHEFFFRKEPCSRAGEALGCSQLSKVREDWRVGNRRRGAEEVAPSLYLCVLFYKVK